MYRERHYDPAEARRLLRRAAELQDREGGEPDGARAMTLAEIQDLAGSAGIDPRFVRQAAAEASPDEPQAAERSAWTGAPTRLVLERTLPGEVAEAAYAGLVDAIRRAVGDAGRTERVGSSLAWTATSAGGRQLHVTIVPEEGVTTIRVEEGLKVLANQLFGGVLAGVGGGGLGLVFPLVSMLLRNPLAATILSIAYFAAVFLLVRSIFAAKVQARSVELAALLDRLAARAARSSPAPERLRVEADGAPERAGVEADALAEAEAARDESERGDADPPPVAVRRPNG